MYLLLLLLAHSLSRWSNSINLNKFENRNLNVHFVTITSISMKMSIEQFIDSVWNQMQTISCIVFITNGIKLIACEAHRINNIANDSISNKKTLFIDGVVAHSDTTEHISTKTTSYWRQSVRKQQQQQQQKHLEVCVSHQIKKKIQNTLNRSQAVKMFLLLLLFLTHSLSPVWWRLSRDVFCTIWMCYYTVNRRCFFLLLLPSFAVLLMRYAVYAMIFAF